MTDNIDKQPRDDSEPAEYRPDTLLAPATLLKEQPELLDVLNRHLESSGISIEREFPDRDPRQGTVVPLLLRTRSDAKPARALDATETLRRLHTAEGAVAETARQLSPERILYAPKPPDLHGNPTDKGHAEAGGRIPVVVAGSPPAREPLRAIQDREGRRPVVAILDTGVDAHDWFNTNPSDDAFCIDARQAGWSPCSRTPVSSLGLDTHTGHGTFIAGIIRQVAPDARVLSLRVMSDAGAVDDSLLIDALRWLRDHVSTGDRDNFVDVVSLSFGYEKHDRADRDYTSERLRPLLWELGGRGVRVVTSAGNRGCDCPTYPAALAKEALLAPLPLTRLVSVGATNPNGRPALYSNYGDWVTDKEVGSGIVSTFPSRAGNELAPTFGPTRRGVGESGSRSIDPDDFTNQFARWSGTSFAAPWFAARLAGALLTGEKGALLDISPEAARARADRALETVQRRGPHGGAPAVT